MVIISGLAGSAWLALRASTVSAELNSATQLVPQLRGEVLDNDRAAAAITVDDLQRHTTKARQAAADPVWTIAAELPWVGVNFQAAREIATSADDVARLGAVPLVDVFGSLDWKSLVPAGQGLNLKPLIDAQPKLTSAAHAVRQSSNRLNSINADVLMAQISEPLVRAREQLTSLRDSLDAAADASSILPTMMGDQSPRRYLLLIQNNAESRATGGIPGALAVLTVDKGNLSLGSQTSATALGTFVPTIVVDPEQEGIYSARMGKFMQDVNFTPDFPTAARTAQTMWEKKTGERLDGALSIDPVALSYILGATGPVPLSDPALSEISGGKLPAVLNEKNVVPTLLSNVYSEIAEPELQDAYFAAVAMDVFTKLSDGGKDPKKLVDALTRGASERRVLLWSTTQKEQAVIARHPLGGSVSGEGISPSAFSVYFNDGTGAKMDYYVKRTVQLVKECTTDGYGVIKVRVKSTNTAPKDAATVLPAYVTGAGIFGVPAGSIQTNVVAYGPVQANIEEVFVQGTKTPFASHRHDGRPVATVTVRLAPGQSNTVEFTFGKIVQHAEPQLSITPSVQPIEDVVAATQTATCLPPA